MLVPKRASTQTSQFLREWPRRSRELSSKGRGASGERRRRMPRFVRKSALPRSGSPTRKTSTLRPRIRPAPRGRGAVPSPGDSGLHPGGVFLFSGVLGVLASRRVLARRSFFLRNVRHVRRAHLPGLPLAGLPAPCEQLRIGRASCRERV